MPTARTATAHHLLVQAARALEDIAGPGAEDGELLAVLMLAEGAARQLDRVTVAALVALERRGVFAERGYRSPVTAVADLLGCERSRARTLLLVAEQVGRRVGLDGTPLPPRLAATAAAFGATGDAGIGVGHVEVIARVLGSPAAARLAPQVWAAAEEHLAAQAASCGPAELTTWGTALVEALDADGAGPDEDERPPVVVNELYLRRFRDRPGGTVRGRFDDGAMFDAIATVIDAATRPVRGTGGHSATHGDSATVGDSATHGDGATAGHSGRSSSPPGGGSAAGGSAAGGGAAGGGIDGHGAVGGDVADLSPGAAGSGIGAGGDERTPAQRAAAALADACGFVLDHGDLPQTGGVRPHVSVQVRLEDLEHRARGAVLDLGGTLSPASVRQLVCDAGVVPVVLGGEGQPVDIGRSTRSVPDGMRRAVIARDRGCARCGRPPSWCEVHHVVEWQHGGPTALANLVLLCRACHRLVHHAGWSVRLVGGRAVFTPPAWIDPDRRPRAGPPRVIDLDAVLATAGASPS